jgi:hypothetical protein
MDFQPNELLMLDNVTKVQFVKQATPGNSIVKVGQDTHLVLTSSLSREEG